MFDSHPIMEQGHRNQIGDFHMLIPTGPSGQEYTHSPQASETGMGFLFYIAKITADRLGKLSIEWWAHNETVAVARNDHELSSSSSGFCFAWSCSPYC